MEEKMFVKNSKIAARLLLGLMLVTAAVLKLLSIDNFEIYIYSFDIFSFTLTTVFSRLLIAAEILLGLGLIFKVRYKELWWLTMLMMAGFTLFLIYVMLFRNDDNCNCFGDLIKLNPSESIYKNIVSILLLLLIRKEKDAVYKPKFRKWLTGMSIAAAVILPFVVFPMDSVYNKIVSKDNNINTMAFENSLHDSINIVKLDFIRENDTLIIQRDSLARFDISDDRYIISYVSAGCRFCKMGAEKLAMIFNRNNISERRLKFLIWGYDADIIDFAKETNTMDCEYWFISPMTSLDITFGRFPVFAWTDSGAIANSGDSRDLAENEIRQFLK
ncbi:MAG: DoxX family protein [Bacteroidales bacterium]|nr:DoxX family protein [Bacteroidales bacterium]